MTLSPFGLSFVSALCGFAAACVLTIVFAAKSGWWLRDRFSEVKASFYEVMRVHEDKDQARHEENLERFGKFGERLASIEKNGRHS